jgi:hypothetical protein
VAQTGPTSGGAAPSSSRLRYLSSCISSSSSCHDRSVGPGTMKDTGHRRTGLLPGIWIIGSQRYLALCCFRRTMVTVNKGHSSTRPDCLRNIVFHDHTNRLREPVPDLIGVVLPLLHPFHNVGAGGDFPVRDARHMPERLQLTSDPVRPRAIVAGIADENVRHARCLARSAPWWPLWHL